MITLAELETMAASAGGTDLDYLRHHFPRFLATKAEFDSSWRRQEHDHVLDIGAHWLHQGALYATDGFKVTAMDLPLSMEHPAVVTLAGALGIELISCSSLEQPADALSRLADDSVSVVLFTEILEHITFNPVAMWKAIYRVLRPGGRIVVTTPNYYAMRGRAWDPLRVLQRFGGGPTALEILRTPTYGHHWKEYSLREIIYYFCVLSDEFNTTKAKYVLEYSPGYLGRPDNALTRWLERTIPPLRPCLHLEIQLMAKDKGIRLEPTW